jgi:Rps23 Pro-64 3,4-dihydroxylase Tpa1-like proline 4-hydroxylase
MTDNELPTFRKQRADRLALFHGDFYNVHDVRHIPTTKAIRLLTF